MTSHHNLVGRMVENTQPNLSNNDPFLWSPSDWTKEGCGPLEVVGVGVYRPQSYVSEPIQFVALNAPGGLRNMPMRYVRVADESKFEAVHGFPRPGGEPDGFKNLGLYRVFWKDDGGESVASIGMSTDGRLWLAPSNWLAPSLSPDWDRVDRVEALVAWGH